MYRRIYKYGTRGYSVVLGWMLFRFADCIVHRTRWANAIAFAMKRSSYIGNKTKSGECDLSIEGSALTVEGSVCSFASSLYP
jgi:hypothetical protein